MSLCPSCLEIKDDGYKGYRKHIIFDLLKDKADLFYSKMLERKIMEEEKGLSPISDDELSQDSENYNEDYKLMVENSK